MKLSDPVNSIKGINDSYSSKLANLDIFTLRDLITHFPRTYLDSSKIISIKDLLYKNNQDEYFTLKVKVVSSKNLFIRGGKSLQSFTVKDESGEILAQFFNQPYLVNALKINSEVLLNAKLKQRGNKFYLSPKLFENVTSKDDEFKPLHLGRIVPEYKLTAGIGKKWFRGKIKSIVDNLEHIEIKDELSAYFNNEMKNSLLKLHFPESEEELNKARKTLSIYELVNLRLKVEKELLKRQKNKMQLNINSDIKNKIYSQINNLPFEPTVDQLNILKDLLLKLEENKALNDLVIGDVGSGKTLVAQLISYLFILNKKQVVILVPTTVLATQHFNSFTKFFEKTNVRIKLITSQTDSKEETNGDEILIGTTAILKRKDKIIKNPGLLIVDEQHKFGVQQREELLKYQKEKGVNYLSLSATPIPRSLAEVIFGDIGVHYINVKPKNRLAIKTFVVSEEKRKDGYDWIKQKIKEGEQVYWVCPLVEDSDIKEVDSVKSKYNELKKYFKGTEIGLLYGGLKEEEKLDIINKFKNNEFKILVSTTVIEVGIDVPNATIMVIESGEKFGLAQLHQIRGRVGRGQKQSWCFIFHNENISEFALKRLKFLSENDNGLKIAEFDLQTRGPGEVYGTMQSGVPNFKVANLSDTEVIKEALKIAREVFKKKIYNIELFS